MSELVSVSESASNYIEGDLVNFNKMRRVSEIVYYIYLIKMSTKCIIVVCIIHAQSFDICTVYTVAACKVMQSQLYIYSFFCMQYTRIIHSLLQHQKDPYDFNFDPEVYRKFRTI